MSYHATLLRRFVLPAQAVIERSALQLADRLQAAIDATRPAAPAARGDAAEDARWVADVDAWVADVQFVLAETVTIPEAKATAQGMAIQIDAASATETRRTIERLKPVDPMKANPELKAAQADFTRENVKLITSIPAVHAERVGEMVKRAVASSTRAGALSKQLLPLIKEGLGEESGIAKRRAMLIARTEVAKQFGQLTQIRQQAAGIESYTWATAHDDRVRPSHRANDAKVFKWADAPAGTGHPGADFQCRCVAIAVI